MTYNFYFNYDYKIDENKRKYQVLVSIDWNKPWTAWAESSVDAFQNERQRIYKLLFDNDVKYKGGYLRSGFPNQHDTILYNFHCKQNLVTFRLLVEQ